MKNSYFKHLSFLVFALGLSISSIANQNLNASYEQSQTFENYYVQPGEVYIASNGIYASIDGVLIPINTLCADEMGIFVPYTEFAGRLVKCPFCQHWYDPDSKVPHKCRGNPD